MRILSENTTSAAAAAPPPEALSIDNDLVVILAALLCALICVIGLVAVARCAWLRRFTSNVATANGGNSSFPPPHVANKGVKKKILRALPKHKFDGGSIDGKVAADCVICLAEFADGEEIRILPPCGHSFHVGCIDTWLSAHSSCPSCRQILVANRCQKCGGVPDNVATASSSGGGIQRVEMEAGLKAREDVPNSYLP